MPQTNVVNQVLAVLVRERDAISRALEVLQPVGRVKRKYTRRVPIVTPENPPRKKAGRRPWTQAQRRLKARQMRKYWRERRGR